MPHPSHDPGQLRQLAVNTKKPPATQMTGGSNKDQEVRTASRSDLLSRFQQMLFLGCRAWVARIACCFLGSRTRVAGTTGGLGSSAWVAGTTGSFLGGLTWVARCICRNVADSRRQDNCASSKTQDNRKSSSARQKFRFVHFHGCILRFGFCRYGVLSIGPGCNLSGVLWRLRSNPAHVFSICRE